MTAGADHSLRSVNVLKEREEQEYPIRVYLRVRPLSKYEVSRRSKNCIQVHPDDMNGTTRMTIDSPYEGQYDYSFDQILDENAKQRHVYEAVAQPLVHKFTAGYNCAILMYGSSQSGRTYTMMGKLHPSRVYPGDDKPLLLQHGDDPTSVVIPLNEKNTSRNNDETHISTENHDTMDESMGIIQQFVHDLFQSISQQEHSSIQHMVHCTYIEVYMEAVRDLLNPGSAHVKVMDTFPSGTTRLEGASQFQCKNKADVVSLLSRGNAIRTILESRKQTDLRHSHSIFTVHLQQKCTLSGRLITSFIHFVDMAASDNLANKPYPNNYNKAMNASSSALHAVVRSLTDGGIPRDDIPYKNSILTRILPLGGNCLSCVVCTVSPASLNVEDTLASARFGDKCKGIRNRVLKNIYFSPEEGLQMLQDLIINKGEKQSTRATLIETDHRRDEGTHNDNRDISSQSTDNLVVDLQLQMETMKQSKENMNNDMLGLQSEVLILRHENDCLLAEKKKAVGDLITTQNEMLELQRRKTEVENNLRTSQFRESEATVFLRQFRIFYRRLLQNKSTQGRTYSSQLFAEPPGVPGIHDMVDIDTLLWRSGLLEDDEVDSDGKISSKYRPSAQALTRSSIAAANLETPSESLHSQDFEFLQLELKAVVEKSYALHLALQEAEATIELLSSNNGSLAKLRLGEESLSLKKALLEKENDLQAIIWKMNELNLVNKTYDKKLSNMVEHMNYLTEALHDVQDEYRNAIESNRKTIKKLQDDGQQLSSLVNSLTMRKEESGNQLDFTPLFSVQSEFSPQISIDRDILDSLHRISHSKELPNEDSSTSEISENGFPKLMEKSIGEDKLNGFVINDEYTDELKQMIQKWSQCPDEMLYVGAKLNSYSPVRFTEKFGPQIRLATFQEFIRSVKC